MQKVYIFKFTFFCMDLIHYIARVQKHVSLFLLDHHYIAKGAEFRQCSNYCDIML